MHAELAGQGRRLPGIYREAAEALQAPGVRAAAAHYGDFVSMTGGGEPDQAPAQASDLLPTLLKVSHADLAAEEAAAAAQKGTCQGACDTNGGADAPQHGDGGSQEGADEPLSGQHQEQQGGDPAAAAPPAEISWDVDLAAAGAEEQGAALEASGPLEVSWDIDAGPASHDSAGPTNDDAAAPGDIDWGISTEDAGGEAPAGAQPPAAPGKGAPLGLHFVKQTWGTGVA